MLRACIPDGQGWSTSRKGWMLFPITWPTQTPSDSKMTRVTSQAFDQVLAIKVRDGSEAYHNEAIGHLSLGVKIGEVYTDYSQGSIRQTGNSLDVALSGQWIFYRKCDRQKWKCAHPLY